MHPERPSDPSLSFVLLDGARPLAYTDEGRGPPAVMVHGLPGSSRDFRWLAPAARTTHRVLRPDLPGFGGTPEATAPGFDIDSRAAVVADFIRATCTEPAVLVGHSMGGMVATALTAAHPELVRLLVLVATPGLKMHRGLKRMRLNVLVPLLRAPDRARRLQPLTEAVFSRVGFRGPYPPGALRRTLLQVGQVDFSAHAANIAMLTRPTAVVWCEDDPLIEAEIAVALGAACPPGPRLGFSDGGHNPQKHHATQIAAMIAAETTGRTATAI